MMLSMINTPSRFGIGMCLGLGSLTSLACSTEDKSRETAPPLLDATITPPDVIGAAGRSGRDSSMEPDTGLDSPTDAGRVLEPFAVTDQFIELPCQFPGDIDIIGSTLYGTCTTGGTQAGDNNHIFRADMSDTARPIPTDVAVDLPEEPGLNINQVIPLSDTRAVVTANDRFYEVDFNDGTHQERSYPAGHNSGAGGVRVNDEFFLVSSNFNGTSFDPGGLHRYNVVNDQLNPASATTFTTSGLNATGIALLDSARLMIMNSGEFSDSAEAVVDFFDSNAIRFESENLVRVANFTAQVGGEVAVFGNSNGQLSILGSAAFSNMTPFAGQLLFINLASGAVERMDVPDTLFHSSIKIDELSQIAYVTDFNAGTVNVIDLQERTVFQSLQVFNGNAGPSELHQGQLIQTGPYQAALIGPTP